MKILVTGGGGYMGTQIVWDLLKTYKEYKVIVVDNFSRGKVEYLSPHIKKFNKRLVIIPSEKSDIRDSNNFREILKEQRPEIVINLAAIVNAFNTNRAGKDQETEIVNNQSAVEIAKISKEMGVKIFIQQSTASLYSQGEELNENSPKEPLSVYGLAKLKAEKEILDLNAPDFKTCAMRSATLIGFTPGFNYDTIINIMCIRGIYNLPFTIFESALKGKKTFLDVKDQSRALIFLLENIEKVNGEAFNIASFNTSMKEVLEILKKEIGKDIIYFIKSEHSINQQVYTMSSKKLKKMGFQFKGELKEILISTLEKIKERKLFLENSFP